jgi:hypothetical protein
MSNVLVVEPRKILQHATAIALFPDHEARVVDAIPEARLAHECDAVIVDAVVLREVNGLPDEALQAISEWSVPIVWIDNDAPQPPACANLAIVKRPISRDELRAALATCLGRQLMLRANAAATPEPAAAASGKMIKQKAAAPAPKAAVIELVEVVEEAAPGDRRAKK